MAAHFLPNLGSPTRHQVPRVFLRAEAMAGTRRKAALRTWQANGPKEGADGGFAQSPGVLVPKGVARWGKW